MQPPQPLASVIRQDIADFKLAHTPGKKLDGDGSKTASVFLNSAVCTRKRSDGRSCSQLHARLHAGSGRLLDEQITARLTNEQDLKITDRLTNK